MLSIGKLRNYSSVGWDVISETNYNSKIVTITYKQEEDKFILDDDTIVYYVNNTDDEYGDWDDMIYLVGKTTNGYYFYLRCMTCLRQGVYCRDCCLPYIKIKADKNLDTFMDIIPTHIRKRIIYDIPFDWLYS